MVDDQIGDDPDAALMRRRGQGLEVLDDADGRVDLAEVGDVIAVVLQGRLVDRHQPEAVDPELAQVVELLDQPAQVAVAVAARIVEAADIGFVDDGIFVPIRRVPFDLVPFHRAPPSREDSPDSPLRSVVSTVSEGLIDPSRGRRGDVIGRGADPGRMRTSRPVAGWPGRDGASPFVTASPSAVASCPDPGCS
jgi:hypothetical protein